MPPITMLFDSVAGGVMSMLLPPQMSSAPCWNKKAKPTVSSTCRKTSLSMATIDTRLKTTYVPIAPMAATAPNLLQLLATKCGHAALTVRPIKMPMPSAIAALRRYSNPSERKNNRSIAIPISAIASAAAGIDRAHEPVALITDSAMYPPHKKYAPWERLTIRMTPKISDRPLPTRNSSAPYEIPLNVWTIHNCVFISPPHPSVYSKVVASLHELEREGTP